MASVVEELAVQSSPCSCPRVMDRADQVQGLFCTGCACDARCDGCTYLELPRAPLRCCSCFLQPFPCPSLAGCGAS